ncbi:uncharacterized protein LOC122511874 [Leptopilina heterotoma]|uniref:uncharacterized protein LOC122511874 n=1 Tax=Leptopilina heterotoma TaxID=63436 RepID=UPI001CA851BB|nr:uncharacterized protein LOC122511874 [Leptopilina heterotoma]XP_043483362.1 uncharacterized protein LOC122511874 [Leptopilina heterotoma]XP_043483370.1 uncharacterized protein LOC122511874 [Leptopilina heterotoma]
MESTTFISPMTPMTNNQFFSVCHYITTLGIILNNHNLLSSSVENETVPVLNAFFEYLNKSKNESAAKIHLFKEIRSKINISGFEDPNNLEDANKLYQYIINMGLFVHYGNITGYVRNIYQDNNNSFSNLQEMLFHDFSNNLTTKNICSLRKESKNLNFLAIGKIFAEYVLPVFTEMWKGKKNLKVQRNDLKIVKRFRRQESSPEDSDLEIEIDEDEHKEVNISYEILSKLELYGVKILKTLKERDLFCAMIKSLALEQVNAGVTYSLELWLLEFSSDPDYIKFLFHSVGFNFTFHDFKLLSMNPSGQVPPNKESNKQANETRILYFIRSSSLNGFIDLNKYNLNNLYLLYPDVTFTVTGTRYEKQGDTRFLFIDLERNDLSPDRWYTIINTIKNRELSNARNSRRMNAIKRAAELISSNVSMTTFTKAVNMLKSYILSVDTDNPNLPTYDQLAHNYLQHLRIMDSYSPWKINNSKYINDVLYKSKFYFQHNNDQYYWKLKTLFNSKSSSIFDYYYNMYTTDLDIFQKKIRFEDFFRISYTFNKRRFSIQSNLKVALLRMVLRQCDEELNEEPIVLYQAFYMKETPQNMYIYKRKLVTLRLNKACSENRHLVLSNILNDTISTGIVIFLKIHLKSRCGVADVYEFFRNEIKSHFLPIDEKYKRIERFEKTIENQKVIFLTLEPSKTISKEEKMIKIVNVLNFIYENSPECYIEK